MYFGNDIILQEGCYASAVICQELYYALGVILYSKSDIMLQELFNACDSSFDIGLLFIFLFCFIIH